MLKNRKRQAHQDLVRNGSADMPPERVVERAPGQMSRLHHVIHAYLFAIAPGNNLPAFYRIKAVRR
ncbi:MAG: hypothetical protein C0404_03140 [Verrucomicrobia bacterium]|nr:hypothetical protein [Verrucomicrobiota bacterium]